MYTIFHEHANILNILFDECVYSNMKRTNSKIDKLTSATHTHDQNKGKVPFYTLKLPESAEKEIIKKYGDRQVSKNIILMFNLFLKQYMVLGKRIYDYCLLGSAFYRGVIKDRSVKISELLEMYLEPRVFTDGKMFRKKTTYHQGEGKHYRFKAAFLQKHGLMIIKTFVPKRDNPEETEDVLPVEHGTNQCLQQIELPFDLLNMSQLEIERDIGKASAERFHNRTTTEEKVVKGRNKRFDYVLEYPLEYHDLYEKWETKIGAYRMYNSLVNLIYSRKDSRIHLNNHRLHHILLQVPKEALRFIMVEGEPLVEFDLKNSQPCILMNLLFGKLKIPFGARWLAITSFETQLQKLRNSAKGDLGLRKLIESGFNGRFYEIIQELSGGDISREEAKKAVMFILFSNPNAKWNPSREIWVKNFPTLYYFIQNFKKALFKVHRRTISGEVMGDTRKGLKVPQNQNKGHLAVLLQQLEALIFVEHILPDLYDQGFFALTKHDALLCKQSDAVKVKQIIKTHLDTLLGWGKYRLQFTNLCSECLPLAA